MNFPGITLIFVIINLFDVDITLAQCPLYQVPHTVDAMTVCCHPVFVCGKDHEVIDCTEDGGRDQCVPCSPGEVNSYITSSLDTKRHVCFFKTKSHEDCPIQDTYATADNESCENMYCRCKTDDCRYGNVCHICEKKVTECGVNEEINAVTGDCEPCKEMMNSPAGCGPCLYNETAWRLSQERKQRNGTSTSQKVATKVTKPVVTGVDVSAVVKDGNETAGTGYIIATDNPSNTSVEPAKQNNGDDGFSMTPVIIIIAIIVFVGTFVALYLYIIKKLKKGDTSSRVVVLYNRLVPNNKYRQRANQDAESTPQNGNVVHSQNTEGRQTQAVSPMIRQTEDTIEETSEGAACGENACMALLKNEDTCSNEGEATRQKQTTDDQQTVDINNRAEPLENEQTCNKPAWILMTLCICAVLSGSMLFAIINVTGTLSKQYGS